MVVTKTSGCSSPRAFFLLLSSSLLWLLLLLLCNSLVVESFTFRQQQQQSSFYTSFRPRQQQQQKQPSPCSSSVALCGKKEYSWHHHQDVTNSDIGNDAIATTTATTTTTWNSPPQRRQFLTTGTAGIVSLLTFSNNPDHARATAESTTSTTTTNSVTTTATAQVTDRIYITISGLPKASSDSNDTATTATATTNSNNRIVIGLFGRDAPESASKLLRLASPSEGLPAPCRPRAVRSLQKEQLEANKVYASCKEIEDTDNVTYLYSTVWRIVPNRRIDLGAVKGKYVAREYPDWTEPQQQQDNNSNQLKHDVPGTVSVRRGNQSGFGFTIYPGPGVNDDTATELDHDNIVVGRVLEGMDVVQALNAVPVVATSSRINYRGLAGRGGGAAAVAPDRSCRYGGPMYCNENKPLIKLTITDTGIL